MRTRPHRHPCGRCGIPTECGGELEQNIDGFPEVICHAYHIQFADVFCEACVSAIAAARELDELENV